MTSLDHKDAYGGNIILSSPGMHEMADRIAVLLKQHPTPYSRMRVESTQFANGEFKPELPDTVRGAHVFLLQALQEPDPNTALMQMFLTNGALKRASVAGITLVLPYIPYLRQDRKDAPRVSISARDVADLIEANKRVDRIITLDMHSDQAEGFFSIPVDHINARVVHAEYFREKLGGDFSNVVVVAPDFGSAVRAERFARQLGGGVPVSIIQKRRPGPNQSEVVNFIGASVEGKIVIIYDDMIDTGGTNRGAVAEIMQQGALEVYTCATHGIFSNGADDKFWLAHQNVVVTTSIPRTTKYCEHNARWLSFVSIDALLADAIHEASVVGGSISKLSNGDILTPMNYLHIDRKSPELLGALAEAPVYTKKGVIQARSAVPGEKIHTILADGTPETENTATEGDWIITNPSGEQHIISAENFRNRYEETQETGVYKCKGSCRAIVNPFGKPIEIMASWGSLQTGDEHCMIADTCDADGSNRGGEPYLIDGAAFKETYA